MRYEEAHVPLYLFPQDKENAGNGFIVDKKSVYYVYTVLHAKTEKKFDYTWRDQTPRNTDLFHVKFANGKRKSLRFTHLPGTEDIATSKINNSYGQGLIIQATADKGNKLHLIGFNNNRLFTIETEVVQINERELELHPIHKEDAFGEE